MSLKQILVAAPVAFCVLGSGVANAGEPIKDTGAMACVNDKWDVKEPEKGHKLVDAAMRCVLIPDDSAEPTITQDCAGNSRTQSASFTIDVTPPALALSGVAEKAVVKSPAVQEIYMGISADA